MRGSCGLGADDWSGDMFVVGLLDEIMIVVSYYFVCLFWEDCRFLLSVSYGLN